jgi:hypothetical protein
LLGTDQRNNPGFKSEKLSGPMMKAVGINRAFDWRHFHETTDDGQR